MIKRQWEDENGKWIEQEDGSILHTEQSQKWKDENPFIEVKPDLSEIDYLKRENALLKIQMKATTERADFHEAVLEEIILTVTP